MSRRFSWIDVTGLVLGLVALAATVFSFIRLFGGGPAGGQFLPRFSEAMEGVGEGFARNLRTVRPGMPWVGGWETAEGEETVTGTQTELVVNNVSGPIRVVAWDQDAVKVHHVKQARTKTDLEDFVIEVRPEGNTVNVRPIYSIGATGRFGSVDLEISVPARIRKVSLHNVSGDIEVLDLPGAVTRELSTVSGAIVTRGPGDLVAKSTSGSVEFDFAGDRLEAGTVSGRISGTISSAGQGGVDLGSVSGSIQVEVVGDLHAALDLRSLSGSIQCDYPVTISEQTRGKLKGTVGSGGMPFTVHTTSGSIRIEKD